MDEPSPPARSRRPRRISSGSHVFHGRQPWLRAQLPFPSSKAAPRSPRAFHTAPGLNSTPRVRLGKQGRLWEDKPWGKVVLKFLMPGEREGSQSPAARKTRGKSHWLCGIRTRHQLPSAPSQLEQPPSHWEQRNNTLPRDGRNPPSRRQGYGAGNMACSPEK